MNLSILQAALEAENNGDFDAAIERYSALLAADPACVEALNNLGALAFRLGHQQDALNFYRQALDYQPDFQPSRLNLARALATLGEFVEADACYRAANQLGARLESEHAQMLIGAGQVAAAQSLAQDACLQRPTDPDLWLSLGNARLFQQSPEEAELCYRKTQTLADTPRARANLSLALLAQSRFAEAWPLYESRYHPDLRAHDAVKFETLPWPQWQGEALAGKRILVVGEQGFGDQIHFSRFIEILAAQGAQVDLLCKPTLTSLLATAAGFSACFGEIPPQNQYDCWTPLLNLPMLLGKPNGRACFHAPYLQADATKRASWRQQLSAWGGNKRKIGLVWAGASGNTVDALRSLQIEQVLALVNGLGDRNLFLSLQTGEQTMADLERLCLAGLIPVGDMLHDFSDTAALVAELDLVIAVDTALAHLAGALGKPAWLLLPGTDWRWGKPGAQSCELYPSVRPFWRDPVTGWDKALLQLTEALRGKT